MRNSGLWLAALAVAAFSQAANAQFQIKGAVEKNQSTGITTVAQAQQVLSGAIANNGVLSATSSVVNFYDPYQKTNNIYSYHFQSKTPFVVNGGSTQPQNNFAIQADANLIVPLAGTYTFGVNSDDGFLLTINNAMAIENLAQRAAGDTLGTVTFAKAGTYPLELIYFQNLGQASVELYASPGTHTSSFYDSTANFQLVGGSGSGALQVATTAVPEPASVGLVVLMAGGLLARRRRA